MSGPADASAPPTREPGLRTRAGNAMARTRAALLDGASRAVEKYGARRSTMSDIASLAGIAKGTLYNHFRTKDAVYAAALEGAVRTLADECVTVGHDDLAEALALAAERIGSHPALRRIAVDEPAVLAALTTVGSDGVWLTVRTAVRDILAAAGRDAGDRSVEVAMRWLVSFVAAPGGDVEGQAAILAVALPAAPQPSPAD